MKKPEWLEGRLKLQRLPKGLRSPWDQKILTAQLVFDALVRNKQSMGKMHIRLAKEKRVEDLVKILQDKVQWANPAKNDIWENLADYLVMIGVRKTNNTWIDINELFARYEFQTLYNYIFIKLWLVSKYNIIMRYEQNIINHIHNNRPEIIELLRELWADFSSNGEASETNLEVWATIRTKKWSSIEETLDNICSELKLDMEGIFRTNKAGISNIKWRKTQRNTLSKLCYILMQMYPDKGYKTKISDVISTKTGWNKFTIRGQYINSGIKGLKVEIEN